MSQKSKSTRVTEDTMTRTHATFKRPRASIACYRCHHKKVRCDGGQPNCSRCLSTGVLCSYPSSRRSRNTQPANVDPFIDNLSRLEARVQYIEDGLATQRSMIHLLTPEKVAATDLCFHLRKTEQEVQKTRSILAQIRLRGEQRIARGKRQRLTLTETKKEESPKKRKTRTTSLGKRQDQDHEDQKEEEKKQQEQQEKERQDLPYPDRAIAPVSEAHGNPSQMILSSAPQSECTYDPYLQSMVAKSGYYPYHQDQAGWSSFDPYREFFPAPYPDYPTAAGLHDMVSSSCSSSSSACSTTLSSSISLPMSYDVPCFIDTSKLTFALESSYLVKATQQQQQQQQNSFTPYDNSVDFPVDGSTCSNAPYAHALLTIHSSCANQ